MSRIKTFRADIQVTDELLRQGDRELVEAVVAAKQEGQLSRDLTGPRGGRYVPIGDIEYLGYAQVGEDFIRNVWTFAARRQGKYVRPRRDAADRMGRAIG